MVVCIGKLWGTILVSCLSFKLYKLISDFLQINTLQSVPLHIVLHIDFHTLLRISDEFSVVALRNAIFQSIDFRLQEGFYPRDRIFVFYEKR